MKRGGIRKGAGRKLKYNEPTTTVSFRIPVSLKDKVTKAVQQVIQQQKPGEPTP